MIDRSAFADYSDFEKNIKHHNRFFVNSKFIEFIKELIKLNIHVLGEGTKLYRARIHKYEDGKNVPFTSHKMYNPEPTEAIRGRANPDGISYLYLSSEISTCLKEVSPKNEDIITIGEFSLKKNIDLIDFVSPFTSSQNNYLNSLNHCIRLTFSNTQLSARPEIEYLPYQFICELIKNENYSGVKYTSSYDNPLLTKAYNLVLFDHTLVSLEDSKCSLIKIISTNYEFEKIN